MTFIMHLIDMHIYDFIFEPISSLILLTISSVYAIWGGVLELGEDKVKLAKYVIGIFVVVSSALIAFILNKDILVTVALIGFLLGFYDFRLAMKRLS